MTQKVKFRRLAFLCLIALFTSISKGELKAADNDWHEPIEKDHSWCEIEDDHLLIDGIVVDADKKSALTLKAELVWVGEEELKSRLSAIDKVYGFLGVANVKAMRDSMFKRLTFSVGDKTLEVPTKELEGILNPRIGDGIDIHVTPTGYVTLDFRGSGGGKSYVCSFIFHHWQFYMRQVRSGPTASVDVSPATLTSADPASDAANWHESTEADYPWCAVHENHLMRSGTILVESEWKPFALEIKLTRLDEVDLNARLDPKKRHFGIAGGGGNIQGTQDSIIDQFTLKIDDKTLEVPERALSGILNPKLSSGIDVRVAAAGQIALSVDGPGGERDYECDFIFQQWQFCMRKVKNDLDSNVDVLQ